MSKRCLGFIECFSKPRPTITLLTQPSLAYLFPLFYLPSTSTKLGSHLIPVELNSIALSHEQLHAGEHNALSHALKLGLLLVSLSQ